MFTQHRSSFLSLLLLIFVLVAFTFSASAGLGESVFGTTFIHQAKTGNLSCTANSCTLINHPLTNNNPNAVLFVTQLLGTGNVKNPHEVGVMYNGTRWAIFNLDGAAMPKNAHFIVWVSGYAGTVFAHNATNLNTGGNVTSLNNPYTNGSAERIVITTPTLPSGSARNKHNIGVWYNEFDWTIFNQDQGDLKINSSYNVASFAPTGSRFVHLATAENTVLDFTIIDNVYLNNNPSARFMVTQSWTYGGNDTNVYNDNPIGVWYSLEESKWTIFNEAAPDWVAMPEGAAFNVVVLETSYAQNGLMLNGGFEVSKGGKAKPALWAGTTSGSAKRACNVFGGATYAYTGNCALLLKGGSTPRIFTQTITNPSVSASNELQFLGFVKPESLSNSAVFTVTVKYQGGGSDKINVPSGTDDGAYRYVIGSLFPENTVKEITVRIRLPVATGRILIDDVHLLRYLVTLLPVPEGD